MFKSVFAATAALSMSAGAAVAGPYVNVETNAGYPDSEFAGSTTDLHVGYEGTSGRASFYVQGGPALVYSEAADDTETELSGKVGASFAVTSDLGVYGEIAGITNGEDADGDDIVDWGAKVGAKFNF